MGWTTWIAWEIIFCIRYSRLFTFKKCGEITVNPSVRININEIKNRITFKIKTGYYLDHLTPETMTLLGNTKSKIKKKIKMVKMCLI